VEPARKDCTKIRYSAKEHPEEREEDMEFRQIRYALAVAKERSFTKAAARLNISQSAVSEQVKLLEGSIGFSLFRRTGRGIEPTERGRMFLYEAERVVGDLMNLSDVARRLSGVGVETLVMGIGSGLAPILLPRILPEGEFPNNLHLEIKTAPTRVIFDELHDERLDLGIAAEVSADRVPSGLISTALFDLDMVLIAPPTHALASGNGAIDVGLLAYEPIIMNELSIGYGQIVSMMFNDLGIRPRIRAIADNVDTIKVMVEAGVGVAIIPSGSADLEVNAGLLALRPVLPAQPITICAYRSRQGLPRRKEILVNKLIEPFRRNPH
jgi:DNA-binding transcriptional LysR family regulator